MTAINYNTNPPPVHLAGTPHVRGAKHAVGKARKALCELAAVLDETGWANDRPVSSDHLSLGLIELVGQLGPAEKHALRICTALLVRARTAVNEVAP